MEKKRRVGLFCLQVVVSICLLSYLFLRSGGDQEPSSLVSSIPNWDNWTGFWLASAILLTLLSFLAASFRWYQMVHALGLKETFPRLVSHFMSGQFISNFLPTSIGGDILRVARLRKDVGDAPGSFASVVFERLSGWLVLPLFIFAGLLLNPGLRSLGSASFVAFIVGLATLAALGVIILAVGNEAAGRWLGQRAGLLRYIHALHLGVDGLRRNPRDAFRLIAVALGYQFLLVLATFCGARALGIEEVGITVVIAFLPAILIVQVLPVTIGGFGVREGLFVFFLSSLGVSDAEATLLGLFVGLLTVVSSLVGVVPLLFNRMRHRQDTSQNTGQNINQNSDPNNDQDSDQNSASNTNSASAARIANGASGFSELDMGSTASANGIAPDAILANGAAPDVATSNGSNGTAAVDVAPATEMSDSNSMANSMAVKRC